MRTWEQMQRPVRKAARTEGTRIGTAGGPQEDILWTAGELARTFVDRLGPATERERARAILLYGDLFLTNAALAHPDHPRGGRSGRRGVASGPVA